MKEIIKGIIAEMREFIKNPTIGTKTEREVKLEKYLKGYMKDCADRIEVVVAKMETTTSTCKDSLQVGDIAAMREALELARDLILPQCNGGTEFAKACGETVNKIMNALAKPPRNCDVGTPEEQGDRFADFCRKHECTMNCPIKKKWSGYNPSCGILWSQMPYEKEGEK